MSNLDRMTDAELRARVEAALNAPPVDYFAACRDDAAANPRGVRQAGSTTTITTGRSRYTRDSEGAPVVLIEGTEGTTTESELGVAVMSIVCDGTRKSGPHPAELVAHAFVCGPDENGNQPNLADAVAIDAAVVQWFDAENRPVTRRGQALEDLPEYWSDPDFGPPPFRAKAVLTCPRASCSNGQEFALPGVLRRLAVLYAVPGVVLPPDHWPAADVAGHALRLMDAGQINDVRGYDSALRSHKYNPMDEFAAEWAADVLEQSFLRVRLADLSNVRVPVREASQAP